MAQVEVRQEPETDVVSVALEVSESAKLALWDRLPHHAEHFCDVSLRSTDGQVFKAHRLVLSMASDPLFAMLSGSFAEGQQSEVPFESSGEALSAFLQFLYKGTFSVKKAVLPELLRLVHQWEVQPLQSALNELLVKHMTPELCSLLIVDCEVLLVDQLDEMLESYVLENFGACVKTEQFGSWPLHRMIGLLRSDDLVAEHEEEVLAAVMHWHRSGPGRDDATAALLQMVRFALLSASALQSLGSREGLTGLPGVVMSRLAAAALKVHQGLPQGDRWERPDTHDEASFMKFVKLRNSYPYWWADFGCSLRGGLVIAERSGADAEGELEPWAVHIHDQALYIIDGREPCCVLQWPLGATSGRVVVGTGSTQRRPGFRALAGARLPRVFLCVRCLAHAGAMFSFSSSKELRGFAWTVDNSEHPLASPSMLTSSS
ncbi:unnamed protein product [Effrenium voratum]|nr:unnamed protein product [Effrenium voratum]